jgi:hypothetical protein
MQANPNTELDNQYQNLTPKQQAVIDAHAKNPDETNREKARIAGEDILGQGEPVNESYCSEILNKSYAELAQYREEIEQNERPEGQQQTVGDPFDALQPQDGDSRSRGPQTIQERPVKSTKDDTQETEPQAQTQTEPPHRVESNSPIQVADGGDGIVVKFSYRYVQSLLENQETQLPDDLHQQLVDVVLQRAFN